MNLQEQTGKENRHDCNFKKRVEKLFSEYHRMAVYRCRSGKQGGEPFVNLMLEENTGRFFRKMSYESHENPLWYNFLTLIWGWIPWTLVLLVSLFGLKWKEMHAHRHGFPYV